MTIIEIIERKRGGNIIKSYLNVPVVTNFVYLCGMKGTIFSIEEFAIN